MVLANGAREAGYNVVVVTRVTKYGDLIRNKGFELVPLSMQL